MAESEILSRGRSWPVLNQQDGLMEWMCPACGSPNDKEPSVVYTSCRSCGLRVGLAEDGGALRRSNILRLYPEYGSPDVLWTDDGSIDVDELDLSPALSADVRAWLALGEQLLSAADGVGPAFGENHEQRLHTESVRLADQLAHDLGSEYGVEWREPGPAGRLIVHSATPQGDRRRQTRFAVTWRLDRSHYRSLG